MDAMFIVCRCLRARAKADAPRLFNLSQPRGSGPLPDHYPALYLLPELLHRMAMLNAFIKHLLVAVFALTFAGCLTQRTVTEGGHTVKQDYIIKRPLKEAIQNSQ